ncbi:MAG: Mrp/NBP35 family ATP-binding protein [Burkholderiales bacterium]|nr:Mrp/NBP35 family ATP-binding protein [Phycisphaerae bacterium]
MPLTQETIVAALRQVKEPELFKDIVTLNMVKEIVIDGGDVAVTIEMTAPAGPTKQQIEHEVAEAVKSTGAQNVTVILSAPSRPAAEAPKKNLPQVKNVIAVGAGKGGVGKSTLAVNIAVGLHRAGATVGLMDGDIYGPSMPTMLGIKGVPPQVHNQKILPHQVHGVHAITIGSLVEQDKPLIWRGPMAHGAFKQLLLDNTEWPALDYLVVDLPPGTGDVPLTLCQLLGLTGAVVVATPQQVALDDAVRAVRMFQQLGAPVLGMVENMSGEVFGRGGTEKAARDLNLPFLGGIDLYPQLRINSDAGTPHANFEANPALRAALETIVANLTDQVNKRNLQSAPTLEIS